MNIIIALVLSSTIASLHGCTNVIQFSSRYSKFYINTVVNILNSNYEDNYLLTQISSMTSTLEEMFHQDELITEVLLRKSVNPNMLFHLSYSKQHKPFFYNVVFIDGYTAFKKLSSYFSSEIYDFSGFYCVIMSGTPVDEVAISRIFNDLWAIGIVNTILLNKQIQDHLEVVQIYTYFPYSKRYCGKAKPVLLHSIYSSDTGMPEANLFRNRFENFHNCSLKLGTFEIRPFIIKEPVEDSDHPRILGLEADLINILSKRLNFHPVYQFTPNETQWGFLGRTNSTGLLKMIQEREVDLGIAGMSFTSERHELLTEGTVHYTTKVVFVIPAGRLYTPLEKLLRPFETAMWITMAICFSLAAIAVFVIQRSNLKHFFLGIHDDSLMMNLLRIVFGNATLSSPDRDSARIVLFSWIYYCFVIRTVYQGLLFQYLQREQRWPQMETMADIDKSGLTYYMVDVASRFFESTPHVLDRTIFLPQESDNLNKALERLARGEIYGVVYVMFDNVAYYNKHTSEKGMLSTMKNTLALHPIGIHYPKNSPLPKAFDKIIDDLQPSGIINFWAKSYGNYHFLQDDPDDQGEPIPLNNMHLLGCYALYWTLNVAAIVVFGFEVGFANVKKRWMPEKKCNASKQKTLFIWLE